MPLHPDLVEMLQALPRDKTGYVFRGGAGVSKGYHLTFFETAVKRAGLEDFRWHDLRHSFATALREQEETLMLVQDAMGHKSPAMTSRYAHIGENKLRSAINKLNPAGLKVVS